MQSLKKYRDSLALRFHWDWLPCWRKTRRPHLVHMLRTTLFLAFLTLIFHEQHWLESLDDIALKMLPADAFEASPTSPTFTTLVLGLTADFFEKEFGGHTPINREGFKTLIGELLDNYRDVEVIAIDYDLSPNFGAFCDSKISSVCEIKKIERQQQETLDIYLTETLKNKLGNKKIVLVKPLPGIDENINKIRQQWQENIHQKNPQIVLAIMRLWFIPV